MKQVESAGHRIGDQLDAIESRLNAPKAAALGVALAVGVIAGGIGAFVFVLVLLVQLFA